MDVLSKIQSFERAWLVGDICDELAESPDYMESTGRLRLRNTQKRAAPDLPDYPLPL